MMCREGVGGGCIVASSLFLLPGKRRYLLSFPTRRSSDLARCATSSSGRCSWPGAPPRSARSTCRSEEHTSELQSHSDLVCSNLLEKQNQLLGFNYRISELSAAIGLAQTRKVPFILEKNSE